MLNKVIGKERQKMVKFALVGVMNTGVDFAIFVLLVYGVGLSSLLAQIASYSIGVVNSYLLNRKWTFQAAGASSLTEMARFVALTGASYAAATGLLLGLQHGLDWSPILAKTASIFVSVVVNYSGSRFWVFQMQNRQQNR